MARHKADCVSERIREVILQTDESYADISRGLGITTVTLYQWLNRNVYPRVDLLLTFCQYFHVSADWILGLSEKKEVG
jgi:transcriptional regulator with XRE-family HTH domain